VHRVTVCSNSWRKGREGEEIEQADCVVEWIHFYKRNEISDETISFHSTANESEHE
jgi:hypothetical protein